MNDRPTGRTLHKHDPDRYRWPSRPHWGLPEGLGFDLLSARPDPLEPVAFAKYQEDVLPWEDCCWTAWAFAGARCARVFWAMMGHRHATAERLERAAVEVRTVLLTAHLGGWLPPDAAGAAIDFERAHGGTALRIAGIGWPSIEAFHAGWLVAANRILRDRLC
jgi:hypothetical protein